ncbi:MAG: 6-phosphogluconolactonase [Nitrospiria bacterium]
MNRSNPKWMVCKNTDTLNQTALKLFRDLYQQALSKKELFTVLLSGGKTPEAIYALLAESSIRFNLEWNRIHLFWGDERFVPFSNAQSNFGAVKRLLISKISISPFNVHPIETEGLTPTEAAKRYEEQLRRFFNSQIDSLPRFHLIFLGVGTDGHTASLFPGMPELHEKDKWVVSSYIEKLKSHRITVTFPVLNQGQNVLILASGESKADILGVISRADDATLYPVQRIKPVYGKLTYLIDEEAASKLSRKEIAVLED